VNEVETLTFFTAGKGLHSSGGRAKIKPAIEELMQKYHHLLLHPSALYRDTDLPIHCHRHQLLAELDPDNAGVLIVQLTGHSTGRGRVLDANEVSERLEKKDQGCIIM
jgi:hypothetical protein